MIKTIPKVIYFCDLCGVEVGDYSHHDCLKCGTQMCYDCSEKHGVRYNHACHFQGSDDGFYCRKCDAELRASKSDALHNAYTAIAVLRAEHRSSEAAFEAREKRADLAVQVERNRRLP